jgi:hypothetical protein
MAIYTLAAIGGTHPTVPQLAIRSIEHRGLGYLSGIYPSHCLINPANMGMVRVGITNHKAELIFLG